MSVFYLYVCGGNKVIRRGGRGVCNQAAVTAALTAIAHKAGGTFQTVAFEDMTHPSELHLMAKTSILVGNYGAGLMHALFLKAGEGKRELL